LYHERKYNEAIEQYSKAICCNNKWAMPYWSSIKFYNYLGGYTLYYDIKDLEKGIQDYLVVNKLDPYYKINI
jgi:hypothetical protein